MSKLLGLTVRDSITSLTGLAVSHVVLISGNVRYTVHPPGDGVKMSDPYDIDEHTLTAVEDGPTVPVILPVEKISAALGDKVRDLLSGREGIVHAVTTHVNGCVYLAVTERADAQGDKIVLKDTIYHSHDRFELIEAGAFARMRAEADVKKKGLLERARDKLAGKKSEPAATLQPEPARARPPGGPTTRSLRV